VRAEATDARALETTSSKATRVLGIASLVGLAALLLFAFVLSPADADQGDLVRIMYVHVPMAWLAYLAFIVTAVGGAMYLWKRSVWWDLVAASSAEIGVLFCALALFTGSIWGRHTWGTFWEWTDVRIVTTLVLLLMYVGYLALRRIPADPRVRGRRSAVVGIIAALNIPLVRFSVDWWANRTLHQKATVSLENTQIEGLMLFTLMLGLVVFTVLYLWMLVHRFRVAWLEEQVDRYGLDTALAERRAEAQRGVDRAVGAVGRPRGAES
jgi:heme exporter protein C